MRAPRDVPDAYLRYSAHPLAMRLRINAVDCVAQGVRPELSREWVEVDDCGYPIVADGERPPELVDHLRHAAQRCPTPALPLESDL